jgi:predicted MPP superfamily phosphohydrolase
MKILVIPDIHAKTIWKEAIEKYEYEMVIFLGDFVDADWDITDQQMASNLVEIVQFKLENRYNVILLLGNHDIHYMYYPSYPCSGFRKHLQPTLTTTYNTYKHLFQVAWQYKNYLFTHAGVSEEWYKKYQHYFSPQKNLADQLNKIHNSSDKAFLFEVGERRGGFGTEKQYGGPVWADKLETQNAILPGFHQVVGHSKVPTITKVFVNAETSFTYCDCLDRMTEFLLLDI